MVPAGEASACLNKPSTSSSSCLRYGQVWYQDWYFESFLEGASWRHRGCNGPLGLPWVPSFGLFPHVSDLRPFGPDVLTPLPTCPCPSPASPQELWPPLPVRVSSCLIPLTFFPEGKILMDWWIDYILQMTCLNFLELAPSPKMCPRNLPS